MLQVVIDGIDEINPETTKYLKEKLNKFIGFFDDNQLIFTVRETAINFAELAYSRSKMDEELLKQQISDSVELIGNQTSKEILGGLALLSRDYYYYLSETF